MKKRPTGKVTNIETHLIRRDWVTRIKSRIKHAREITGLSQYALAQACGIEQAAVSKWESQGVRDIQTIWRIAEVTHVSPAWIAFGDPFAIDGLDVAPEPQPRDMWPPNPEEERPHPSSFPVFAGMYEADKKDQPPPKGFEHKVPPNEEPL